MAQPVDLTVYRNAAAPAPEANRPSAPEALRPPAPEACRSPAPEEASREAVGGSPPTPSRGAPGDEPTVGHRVAGGLAEVVRAAERGEATQALAGCRALLAGWPDPRRLGDVLADLVAAGLGEGEQEFLLRQMLAWGEDPPRANQLGGLLCRQGRLVEALPWLRQAAPVLGHRDGALWNYTSALAATGHHHELLALEPLLVRLSGDVPPPFGPFAHLAAAKLALQPRPVPASDELAGLRAGGTWLDAAGVAARLVAAIGERRPFSLVMLPPALARLSVYASRQAQRLLTEAELSAVVNSVWLPAFGSPIEAHGSAPAGRVCRLHEEGAASADIVGLPDEQHFAAADQSGFLAVSQDLVLGGTGRPRPACAGLGVTGEIHETLPFLRPLLAEQPFLGVVSSHPELAPRLGRFCHVGETASWPVPARFDQPGAAARARPSYPAVLDETLGRIAVPFAGAVFLVAAGLLGPACCGLIKAGGGIAIDVDALAERWMVR